MQEWWHSDAGAKSLAPQSAYNKLKDNKIKKQTWNANIVKYRDNEIQIQKHNQLIGLIQAFSVINLGLIHALISLRHPNHTETEFSKQVRKIDSTNFSDSILIFELLVSIGICSLVWEGHCISIFRNVLDIHFVSMRQSAYLVHKTSVHRDDRRLNSRKQKPSFGIWGTMDERLTRCLRLGAIWTTIGKQHHSNKIGACNSIWSPFLILLIFLLLPSFCQNCNALRFTSTRFLINTMTIY